MIICKLYNYWFDASRFPAFWRSSFVVPVFKTSEKSGHSITVPLFGKVFEVLIYAELVTSHVLFSDKQYEFRYADLPLMC